MELEVQLELKKSPTIPLTLTRERFSKESLLLYLQNYNHPHGDRLSIEIGSDTFADLLDILTDLTLKTKLHKKRGVMLMRCCLLFWFGPTPDPCAHPIDACYKKEINLRCLLTNGLARQAESEEALIKVSTKSLKQKLEENYERSNWDKDFIFNPSLDEIYDAYTPYLE